MQDEKILIKKEKVEDDDKLLIVKSKENVLIPFHPHMQVDLKNPNDVAVCLYLRELVEFVEQLPIQMMQLNGILKNLDDKKQMILQPEYV